MFEQKGLSFNKKEWCLSWPTYGAYGPALYVHLTDNLLNYIEIFQVCLTGKSDLALQ